MVASVTTVEPPIPSRRISSSHDRRPVQGPNRVLLVEEDSLVRGHLACVLRAAGYVVEEAGTGAEAIWSASEFAADLVVSEMALIDEPVGAVSSSNFR